MAKRLGENLDMTWEDILADAKMTTLKACINGTPFGVFTSTNGRHAEAELCDFFTRWFGDELATSDLERLSHTDDLYHIEKLDIFITRSPCEKCTEALLSLVRDYLEPMQLFDRLRIFCATIYKGEHNGQSRRNIDVLRSRPSVRVYRWQVARWAEEGDLSAQRICSIATFSDTEGVREQQNRHVPGYSVKAVAKWDTRLPGGDHEFLTYKTKLGHSFRQWYFSPENLDGPEPMDISGD